MRIPIHTTQNDFGSFTFDSLRSDGVQPRPDNAARHHLSTPALACFDPVDGASCALAPVAPTLTGVVLVRPSTANLTAQYGPLLRSWWQAAHAALKAGVLNHQEVLDQDFASMQRVMGLAMLDGMQRRWVSGCGPCGRLMLSCDAILTDGARQKLQSVHTCVVTCPSPRRTALIATLVQQARTYIIAGRRDVDTHANINLQAPETLATQLFYAATSCALSARATQTALLHVFWEMLKSYVCAVESAPLRESLQENSSG